MQNYKEMQKYYVRTKQLSACVRMCDCRRGDGAALDGGAAVALRHRGGDRGA